jgi:hypothetical protein
MRALHMGVLGRARSRSMGTEGAKALPQRDPSTSCPCLALNTNYGAPLNFLNSGIGSVTHTLVVPDSIDLKCLFEPSAGQGSDS